MSISITLGEDEGTVRVRVKNRVPRKAQLAIGEFDVFLVPKAKDTGRVNHFISEEVRRMKALAEQS